MKVDLSEYFRRLGQKGGKSKSPQKVATAKINAAKARQAKLSKLAVKTP